MTDDELQVNDAPYFARRLTIDAGADERTIKRAYARELKLIDQESDLAGFQDLREAYEAALIWWRHAAAQLDAGAADPFDEIDRAAKELHLRPAAANDGNRMQRQLPAPAAPELDADTLSQEVFAQFQARCAGLDDLHASASWARELQASLADARLIHIPTRQAFEQRIADLLAAGWRPGHHLLFHVAAKRFEWDSDRRRVQSLGMAGYTLHFAIDQRAMHDQQSDHACEQQSQLINRLREATPPTTNELIDLMPVLATVEARFPAWLALIADADTISHWHNLDQAVPSWRRKLRRRDFNVPFWVALVVLLVVLRLISSTIGSNGHGPAAPVNASVDLIQGNHFLGEDEYDKAILSYDRALSQDPDNAAAYAGRAMALVFLGEKKRALADLEKLESLAPLNPLLFRSRGMLAQDEMRFQDAVVAYTRSLELDPDNVFTIMRRGQVHAKAGDMDNALRDADRVLALSPDSALAHWLRADVFRARKDVAAAKAEADAVLHARDKRGDYAYRIAANIYQEIGDLPNALASMDKAVAASPVANNYLQRSRLRPPADEAARRADIEAALKLEPDSAWGLRLLVSADLQAKQWDAVIQDASRAMAQPSMKDRRQFLTMSRGIGYAKRAEMKKAAADFTSARLAAKTYQDLNELCCAMAVHDVALPTALAICNASLEQDPTAWHTLDSKAFTLMRMKRYREALATYDAAVGDGRANAVPLYGRGVVKHRLGDEIGAQRDMKAALAIRPDTDVHFAHMGVVP